MSNTHKIFYEVYLGTCDGLRDRGMHLPPTVSAKRWNGFDGYRQRSIMEILERAAPDCPFVFRDLSEMYARPLYEEYLALFQEMLDKRMTNEYNIIDRDVWEKAPPMGLTNTLTWMRGCLTATQC